MIFGFNWRYELLNWNALEGAHLCCTCRKNNDNDCPNLTKKDVKCIPKTPMSVWEPSYEAMIILTNSKQK